MSDVMMAVWQTRALILPLLTLHIAWLFPHGEFLFVCLCVFFNVEIVQMPRVAAVA